MIDSEPLIEVTARSVRPARDKSSLIAWWTAAALFSFSGNEARALDVGPRRGLRQQRAINETNAFYALEQLGKTHFLRGIRCLSWGADGVSLHSFPGHRRRVSFDGALTAITVLLGEHGPVSRSTAPGSRPSPDSTAARPIKVSSAELRLEVPRS